MPTVKGSQEQHDRMTEDDKTVVRECFEEVWNKENWAVLDEYLLSRGSPRYDDSVGSVNGTRVLVLC